MLALISDIKPTPSVEKSDIFSFSLTTVLTAFINFASFDIAPSMSAALFLWGRVIFSPLERGSSKNSFIKLTKSDSETLYGKYSKFIPSFLANLECIKGDRECSIGFPTTPSLYFLDIPVLVDITY